MPKTRNSLSRLFLNQPSAEERAHIRRLEAIQEQQPGKPFLLDDGNFRMMYLTPKCMQSAMRLDAPDALVCAYTHAAMGFLLFQPQPKHILVIGLGGGSLVKYCYRHLPDSQITVLEINADVIAMRDQFMIPPDDERLRIIHCDAVNYLRSADAAPSADVIMLDAYDSDGLVEELNTPEFYANCHAALSNNGVLVANVWGKPSAVAPMLSRLRSRFSDQVCWTRSADSYNLIVFAIKAASPSLSPLATHDQTLSTAHPTLQLDDLSKKLVRLNKHDDQGTYATEESDIPALTAKLREILVADDKVPKSYREWMQMVAG